METARKEQILRAIDNFGFGRRYRNFIDANIGEDEIESAELIELLSDSYSELALGIHQDVQSTHQKHQELIASSPADTQETWRNYYNSAFMDRIMQQAGEKPLYFVEYLKIRDIVYDELIHTAVETNDFELVISTIQSLGESELAERFLNTFYKPYRHYPHAVIGGSMQNSINEIDHHNAGISKFKNAVKTYAAKKAKEERNSKLQTKLNDEKTGILGALAIGARLKLRPGVSVRKACAKYIFIPLEEVSQLPSVPEQLIEKEKAGLSILED